jgi:hypothetical protein
MYHTRMTPLQTHRSYVDPVATKLVSIYFCSYFRQPINFNIFLLFSFSPTKHTIQKFQLTTLIYITPMHHGRNVHVVRWRLNAGHFAGGGDLMRMRCRFDLAYTALLLHFLCFRLKVGNIRDLQVRKFVSFHLNRKCSRTTVNLSSRSRTRESSLT